MSEPDDEKTPDSMTPSEIRKYFADYYEGLYKDAYNDYFNMFSDDKSVDHYSAAMRQGRECVDDRGGSAEVPMSPCEP